ncbi:MAG TPA: phosphate ABC transporter substrate-binding protein PstS, partial [Caldimonas sp.]
AELLRSIANPPGAACWPLTAPSFIVVRERPQDVARTRELLAFFDWALTQGQAAAIALDYVPLPEVATLAIRSTWQTYLRDAAGSPFWSGPPRP